MRGGGKEENESEEERGGRRDRELREEGMRWKGL